MYEVKSLGFYAGFKSLFGSKEAGFEVGIFRFGLGLESINLPKNVYASVFFLIEASAIVKDMVSVGFDLAENMVEDSIVVGEMNKEHLVNFARFSVSFFKFVDLMNDLVVLEMTFELFLNSFGGTAAMSALDTERRSSHDSRVFVIKKIRINKDSILFRNDPVLNSSARFVKSRIGNNIKPVNRFAKRELSKSLCPNGLSEFINRLIRMVEIYKGHFVLELGIRVSPFV